MAHARKQIRDAIKTKLTGLSTTGANVHVSRVQNLDSADLPALNINIVKEEAESAGVTSGTRLMKRVLEIAVEAIVAVNNTFDDTLADISEEVEEALASDVKLGGKCRDVLFVGYERTSSGEGETQSAVGISTFQVEYFVQEDDVETAV